MNGKIDVVFSLDANYIQHFCVAVTSLLENNLKNIDRIFLITDIDKKGSLENTFSFILTKYKKEIIYLKFDNSIIKKFKVDSHISQAAYYRLFLPEILPVDVDKVLYLDSDIVVNEYLDSLFQLEFKSSTSIKGIVNELKTAPQDPEEFYLFAVSEVRWQNLNRLQSIGLSGCKYFNSGVLLINLKKWRVENITKKLISIALNYKDKLKFHDQDVLNIAFENYWGELNYKFNTVNLDFLEEKVYKKNYSIIHYTGGSKPWHYRNRHPLKLVYWYYLWKTPYRYYIPEDITFKSIVKKLFKPLLINKKLQKFK
ncbi:MAG: glycosyl transferase, family 8 [Mucilaginibacter sp.]|nr:glycosyl transferase, family 8 [Mucilaginibacter sp.]